MDVYSLPSMALDTRFPAGMTSYLELVYKNERSAWKREKSNLRNEHEIT